MQKGFAPILIVLLIAAVAIGGGVYFYFNQSNHSAKPVVTKTSTPTVSSLPTSSSDETANWQILNNEKYDLFIKYPADLGIVEIPPKASDKFTYFMSLTPAYTDSPLLSIRYYPSTKSIFNWWDSEGLAEYNKRALDFANSNYPTGQPFDLSIFTSSNMFINANQASVLKGNIRTGQIGGNLKIIILSSNGAIYVLEQPDLTSNPLQQKTSDQIISTFRFIQQTKLLTPADGQTPAAGICPDESKDKDMIIIILNEDTPSPRCQIVSPNQILLVFNNTSHTVTFTIGKNDLTIEPHRQSAIAQTFGSYLAPGVHFTKTSLYGGNGPEIWLQK